MPSNIVATARNLDRTNRRPCCSELTRCYSRAAFLQQRAGAAAGVIEKEIIVELRQSRRPIRLDHRWRRSWRWADVAVGVEVLVEGGLDIFQSGTVRTDGD